MENFVVILGLLTGVQQAAILEPQIQRLGSENFLERQWAYHSLGKQLERTPWEELLIPWMRQDRKDPEIANKIHALTRKWNSTFTAEYGKHPWIDALPKDYPNRNEIITNYLSKVTAEFYYPDEDYFRWRVATMLWLEDLRKQGWRMPAIWQVQKEMISNEEFWVKNKRYP